MAKSDRRAPRRAAETPAGQVPADGAHQAETAQAAAEGSAPQQDRTPSGRVRPKRASSRRATRAETEAARAKLERTETRTADHAPRHADTGRDAAGAGTADVAAAAGSAGGTAVKTKTEAPAEPRPARPVRPAKKQRAARRPSWVEASSGPGAPLTAKQDRERATMAHFGVAVGFMAPLAIWLLYRDRGPFTAQEAKEALNFAVPPTLLMAVFFFLGQLPVLGPVFAVIGSLVWMIMAFYGILGGAQVNKGRPYRYPFNLRILR